MMVEKFKDRGMRPLRQILYVTQFVFNRL